LREKKCCYISLSDWHYRLTTACKGLPATRAHGWLG